MEPELNNAVCDDEKYYCMFIVSILKGGTEIET